MESVALVFRNFIVDYKHGFPWTIEPREPGHGPKGDYRSAIIEGIFKIGVSHRIKTRHSIERGVTLRDAKRGHQYWHRRHRMVQPRAREDCEDEIYYQG